MLALFAGPKICERGEEQQHKLMWRPDGRCKTPAGSEVSPARPRCRRSRTSSCGLRRYPRCSNAKPAVKPPFDRRRKVKPHARVEVEAAVGEALDGGLPAAGGGWEEGAELVAVQYHRQPTGGAAGEQHLFD